MNSISTVATTIYRPGDVVPVSGQYGVVNYALQYVGREITCVKGHRFPPTEPGEYGYVLRDVTVH